MPCGAGGSSAPGSSEVPEMAEPSKTEQRKAEHVNIILQENVSAEYNYWNDVRLVHTALPESDQHDRRGRDHHSLEFPSRGRPAGGRSAREGLPLGDQSVGLQVPVDGEGNRCRHLPGNGAEAEGVWRTRHRRRRPWGNLVLRGRALPRAEGGRKPERAPRRHVLELGDSDPGINPLGGRRLATRRHGRRAKWSRRREW